MPSIPSAGSSTLSLTDVEVEITHGNSEMVIPDSQGQSEELLTIPTSSIQTLEVYSLVI